MSDAYVVGEVARLSLTIADIDGDAADPAVVVLRIKAGSTAIQSYTYNAGAEIVRDAVGKYHAVIALSTAGHWYYRWETGAPVTGAADGDLTVQSSRLAQ